MSATGHQRRRRALETAQGTAETGEAMRGLPANVPALPPLTGGGKATASTSTAGVALADMTVKELRALAADKGIALDAKLRAKPDILAAVEKALGEL